jgi:hypothetical protein
LRWWCRVGEQGGAQHPVLGGGEQALGFELLTERAGLFFRETGAGGGRAEFGTLGDDPEKKSAGGTQQDSAGREQSARKMLWRVGHAGLGRGLTENPEPEHAQNQQGGDHADGEAFLFGELVEHGERQAANVVTARSEVKPGSHLNSVIRLFIQADYEFEPRMDFAFFAVKPQPGTRKVNHGFTRIDTDEDHQNSRSR